MLIRHLYHTRAEVLRLAQTMTNGVPMLSWDKIEDTIDPVLGEPGELMCRLDLNFVRPGKDQPMPIQSGRAPDRVGLMFFDAATVIRSGDRIRTLAGPITGTFEIRATPDPAAGFSVAHHMEVQVIEVAQAMTGFTSLPAEVGP